MSQCIWLLIYKIKRKRWSVRSVDCAIYDPPRILCQCSGRSDCWSEIKIHGKQCYHNGPTKESKQKRTWKPCRDHKENSWNRNGTRSRRHLLIFKIFRMGEFDRNKKYPRPVCIQVSNKIHKDIVMSRVSCLKKKQSPFRFAQQLEEITAWGDEEIREKKKQLYEIEKKYSEKNINNLSSLQMPKLSASLTTKSWIIDSSSSCKLHKEV